MLHSMCHILFSLESSFSGIVFSIWHQVAQCCGYSGTNISRIYAGLFFPVPFITTITQVEKGKFPNLVIIFHLPFVLGDI